MFVLSRRTYSQSIAQTVKFGDWPALCSSRQAAKTYAARRRPLEANFELVHLFQSHPQVDPTPLVAKARSEFDDDRRAGRNVWRVNLRGFDLRVVVWDRRTGGQVLDAQATAQIGDQVKRLSQKRRALLPKNQKRRRHFQHSLPLAQQDFVGVDSLGQVRLGQAVEQLVQVSNFDADYRVAPPLLAATPLQPKDRARHAQKGEKHRQFQPKSVDRTVTIVPLVTPTG